MATSITALDTPTDITLATTTTQVTLPANATTWSISGSADATWYPTGTDGGAANANAETLPLSSGGIVELNCPGARANSRNLNGHEVFIAAVSGTPTVTITARA